jgi:hypothetical protein
LNKVSIPFVCMDAGGYGSLLSQGRRLMARSPSILRFGFHVSNSQIIPNANPHSRDAMRPGFAGNLSLKENEGAGKAGCLAHPQPPVQQKSTGVEATGSPEHPAFPAQWF